MHRLLRSAAVLALVAGPLAYAAQPGGADILPPVSDTGLSLQVAQATLTSSGSTAITWQSAASITPVKDTLIRAQFYNDGTLPQLNATLTINAGGKLDPGFTIAPGCAVTPGATSDTVTCSYGVVLPGQAEPFVYLAVQTGSATSIHSTASETATPDSLVPINPLPDGDETGSVTTTVVDSGFAFLTDGQSLTFTSADGNVVETFAVPAGGTNGGGLFVHLGEGDGSTSTCGGTTACYTPMAVANFVQVGGTPPVASNPFTDTITYPNVKQTCNGLGGGSGCNPIYFLPTGVTAGAATQVPKCTTYTPGGGTPLASSDPCIYGLQHVVGNGASTYLIALLTDPGFPIPLL